ncbi:hypothetical protein HH308_06205 [Gordonia sp. TBRC 11910]|uniref:Uncharacterized protein n=1 Tax=Gordonia asplenii TaxID=2725283 RepID=A0A848KP33_9ACTN|nr:hypothetical protein [Gordonia asplenii]NMO00804.1 hypothetical protein [Gordonia asplenii]
MTDNDTTVEYGLSWSGLWHAIRATKFDGGKKAYLAACNGRTLYVPGHGYMPEHVQRAAEDPWTPTCKRCARWAANAEAKRLADLERASQ